MLSRWTCKRCVRSLVAYDENALPASEAARVAAHLTACPACRAERAALQQTTRLLRGHKPPAPEPARNLWNRIQAEIALREPKPSPALRPAALALGAAAAALAVFALTRPLPHAASQRAEAPATAPAPRTTEASRKPAAPEHRSRTAEVPRAEAAPKRRSRSVRPPSVRPRTVAVASRPIVAKIARAPKKARRSMPHRAALVWAKREPPRLAFDPNALPGDVSPLSALPSDREETVPVPAVIDVVPPAHVSAAASAVDEALDLQRQRELFRYAHFSRR